MLWGGLSFGGNWGSKNEGFMQKACHKACDMSFYIYQVLTMTLKYTMQHMKWRNLIYHRVLNEIWGHGMYKEERSPHYNSFNLTMFCFNKLATMKHEG